MIRLALTLALGLASGAPAATAGDIPDGEYQLTRIDGAAPDYLATLRIGPGQRLGGRAPCNIFSAPLKKPLPDFRPGTLMVTRRSCPDLTAEQHFLDRLKHGQSLSFDGTELVLNIRGAAPLIFTPYR